MLLRGERFAARLGLNFLATLPAKQLVAQAYYGATIQRYFCASQPNKFNYFDFGTKMIPHPDKAHKGGEDAYFVHKNVLAVADGVGGWAEVGVDPGLYSKKLMKNMDDFVKRSWEVYKLSPRQLIIDAAESNKEVGSSTVCVVVLDEQRPLLHTALIGDSGYLLLRKVENNLKVLIHSKEQQREFNFPYQIGSEGDPPQIADVSRHQVQNNDIVVVGTDGLFDNLDDQQIINVLKPFLQAGDEIPDTSLVAEMIADLAYKCSLDMKYNSPFARKARAAFYDFRGGKSDDITVAVGQVKLVGAQKSLDQEDFE